MAQKKTTNAVHPITKERKVAIVDGDYLQFADGSRFHKREIKEAMEEGRRKGISFLPKWLGGK